MQRLLLQIATPLVAHWKVTRLVKIKIDGGGANHHHKAMSFWETAVQVVGITLIAAVVGSAFLGLYLLPAIIALYRMEGERSMWIVLVNLLLGWTIIGWAICLGRALAAPRTTNNS